MAKHSIKKICVFTSGGDSPGMNAAIRAVVRSARYRNLEVVGAYRGYEGLINNDFIELQKESVSNIIQRGGTILKTARSQSFRTKEGRTKAAQNLKNQGIDALIAIGGNGTFTGAKIFQSEHEIPCIGIPGTIDNDLYGTDHTLGYDTAINTALDAIDKIRDTADSHERLFFVEVMGRDAGYIAMDVGIAGGAEAILVPENQGDTLHLLKRLTQGVQQDKRSFIIVVAEGDEAGGANEIAEKVKLDFPNFDTRVTILGHIQRGGTPTARDRVLGSRLGNAAVKALLNGQKNQAVGLINDEIAFTSFRDAISKKKYIKRNLFRLAEILSN